MKYTWIVALMLCVSSAYAQFEQDYTPITFSGAIPTEFLQSAHGKTQLDIENREADELSKKQGKEFYVVQNYMLSELFLSGTVYFNDELTRYVNAVADKLLATQPELRQKVNFYVTKSQVPNAFAWRDGSLFINIGLLHYVQNEAQLAFVMAHEIDHYLEQHALLQFKRSKDIENELFSRKSELDAFLAKLKYSREKELQADKGGFDVYRQSNYAPNEALKALQMLDSVDGDYYKVPMDIVGVFSQGELKVDASWLCSEAEAEEVSVEDEYSGDIRMSANEKGRSRNTEKHKYELPDRDDEDEEDGDKEEDDEDEDDRYSTHPSIRKRTRDLTAMLAEVADTTGAINLVGQAQFNRMQQVVAFEIVQEYYVDADYFRSLYEGLRLQQHYPNNVYLAEMVAHNLFWIAYYFDLRSIDQLMENYEQYEGQPYGQFLCFFDYIDADDLMDMAYAHVKQLNKQFANNPEIEIALARIASLNKKKKEARDIFEVFPDKYPDSRHAGFAKQMNKGQ